MIYRMIAKLIKTKNMKFVPSSTLVVTFGSTSTMECEYDDPHQHNH